jgi:hypothetical protein
MSPEMAGQKGRCRQWLGHYGMVTREPDTERSDSLAAMTAHEEHPRCQADQVSD